MKAGPALKVVTTGTSTFGWLDVLESVVSVAVSKVAVPFVPTPREEGRLTVNDRGEEPTLVA